MSRKSRQDGNHLGAGYLISFYGIGEIVMLRRSQYVVLGILWGIQGCSPREAGIKGVVVTNDDLAQSAMSPMMTYDKRYSPVTGAKVYLSFDEEGQRQVPDTVVQSDNLGHYSIQPGAIPTSCYLVVEKDGYETFVYRILVGRFATFKENTVFLKKRH